MVPTACSDSQQSLHNLQRVGTILHNIDAELHPCPRKPGLLPALREKGD
jgi:hypothetical protein